MDARTWALDNLLVYQLSGSRLIGTARDDSDYDYRGVCYMPPPALFGFKRHDGSLFPSDKYGDLIGFERYVSQNEEEDVEIHGLKAFAAMCLVSNPTAYDILCAPEGAWVATTEDWRELYLSRRWFFSQKVRYSFVGFARNQLRRVRAHHKWLTDPPQHEPYRTSFGDTAKEKAAYKTALRRWEQYQHWLTSRNPERAALERKYGFDTKHGCHTIRCLLQAIRMLQTGDYSPVLGKTDLAIVTNVLEGGLEYSELLEYAGVLEEEIQKIDTDLPEEPRYDRVQELIMSMSIRRLRQRG